jgi:Fe-S-cluster containining protein
MCCSVYDHVPATKRDIARLARHFKISIEMATRRYTKQHGRERILRRKKDPLLGQTCIFHDLEKRICGIYEARPRVCRVWPEHGDGSCVYYDVLQFERRQQGEHNIAPLIQIIPLKKNGHRGQKADE